MHPRIYRHFDEICQRYFQGGHVLEVGALPGGQALLTLPAVRHAEERVGLNLHNYGSSPGIRMVQGDATRMHEFEDGRFDMVLCNSVLEHVPRFWLACAEMLRVLKPGGHLVVATPGYAADVLTTSRRWLHRIPLLRRLKRTSAMNFPFCATVTYELHDLPHDYYRFSEQTFRKVILDGLVVVQVEAVMTPPRIIGVGRKPDITGPGAET